MAWQGAALLELTHPHQWWLPDVSKIISEATIV